MRESSAVMKGEKLGVGGEGRRGWMVVFASGEREEAMRAWAAAREEGEGVGSMSVVSMLVTVEGWRRRDGTGERVVGFCY